MATRAIKMTAFGSVMDAVGGGDLAGNQASTATVAADVATLVADGATPTQGHVDTLNTDWTAYLASLTAAASAQSGDAVFTYNDSNVTTSAQKREIVRQISRFLGLPGVS